MIDSNDFITVGELEVVENVNNEDLILFEQDEEIKTFKGKILNDIKEKAEDVFLSLGDKEYLTTERKETIVEAINNVDLTAKNAKKVVDTLNINVVKAVSIENDLEDDSEVDFNLIEKVDSINTELETLKSNLSDCVGYRKFNGEWITAQYTLEDKTRNLVIEGNTKYVKDGVILDEWQEGCELKSVGDLQENGKYKIGLVAKNKNLCPFLQQSNIIGDELTFINNGFIKQISNVWNAVTTLKFENLNLKRNTEYYYIVDKATGNDIVTPQLDRIEYYNNNKIIHSVRMNSGQNVITFTTPNLYFNKINFVYRNKTLNRREGILNPQIRLKTNVNYIESKNNKKDILLQEPLNGIGNVRDIKDNKKIIRKTSLRVLNGSEDWILQRQNDNIIRFMIPRTSLFMNNIKQASLCLCDGFVDINSITPTPDEYCVGVNVEQNDGLVFRVPKSRLETPDVSGFKKFLAKKNIKIVLMLEKYTVEEVEQDMCLNTYKDLTHIYTDTEIQGNISFSTLIDLGTTINRLENTNTANLKLIEEQENRLIEQAYSILDNDTRLCMLELGI